MSTRPPATLRRHTPAPQPEYLGLTAIGAYFGVGDATILRWIAAGYLLAYRRCIPSRGIREKRWRWYTTAGLIRASELAWCARDRQGLLTRQAARSKFRQVAAQRAAAEVKSASELSFGAVDLKRAASNDT